MRTTPKTPSEQFRTDISDLPETECPNPQMADRSACRIEGAERQLTTARENLRTILVEERNKWF